MLDVVREVRAPFLPSEVVEQFADILKAYKIRTVQGDRYAGEWPPEQFSLHGITYEQSELTKSEIYQEFLPLLNSRRAALLKHDGWSDSCSCWSVGHRVAVAMRSTIRVAGVMISPMPWLGRW